MEPSNIPEADAVDKNGKPIDNLDHLYDTFINMEVRLPKGERELYGQVVGLCLNCNGKVIGTPHKNPVLNTLMYEIKFKDGTSAAYTANTIAESMWQSVDNDSHHHFLLHLILDYKFSRNAINESFIYDRNGNSRLHKTTRGVQLLVAIRTGTDPNILLNSGYH